MKFYIQLDSNWFTQWAGWELVLEVTSWACCVITPETR